MGCGCGGGTTTQNSTQSTSSQQSGTSSSTGSGTTRQVLPDWLIDRFASTNGALGATGATADQMPAMAFLRDNLLNDGFLTPAYGTARDQFTGAANGINNAGNLIGASADFFRNAVNTGSNTLGVWFPGQLAADTALASAPTAANAPQVAAGTGAGYMAPYQTGLANDYVNASLADYDAGVGRGFNTLRAGHADAFGNKRMGVAEGQFLSDAARNRAALSSDLRYNAFNTAAGFGQTDASRALAADTTNAANLLNNGQFNAANAMNTGQFNARQAQENSQYNTSLEDTRQRYDISQAEAGDNRRMAAANNLLNAGSALGANANLLNTAGQNFLNSAVNFNNTRVGNANALLNAGNMTMDQVLNLIRAGGMQVGTDTANQTDSSFNSTENSTSTGTSSTKKPGDFVSLLNAVARLPGEITHGQSI